MLHDASRADEDRLGLIAIRVFYHKLLKRKKVVQLKSVSQQQQHSGG